MKIENIYIGTWIPRASIHLKEIYKFLNSAESSVIGLEAKKLKAFKEVLVIDKVEFIKDEKIDIIKASCKECDISISEEGIIMLKSKNEISNKNFQNTRLDLEKFFLEKFSPAIKYLFSLGAPLPKQLQDIREVYPTIITLRDCPKEDALEFIKKENLEIYSENKYGKIEVFFGEDTNIINLDGAKEDGKFETLLQDIIFLKELSLYLANCLNIHREIWEKIDLVREAKEIAYKDFPAIREQINGYLKTLSLTKARINQMSDIIETRKELESKEEIKELNNLKINRTQNLIGDIKYIKDLWEITIEYANNTLNLLDSLSQESIQRELSTLKFVSLLAAITSFFGMNIAFPWEERWPNTFIHSFVVIVIIAAVALLFYFFLKIFVYNRKFKIKDFQ
ncbi:MAG: hypothetical protein A2312_03695 [Candidatus Staskawiczbacteria bacterium RIFOXYB2_FULL_32_9]|uniref:Uncharacterized protein n=1 Tax=Candidatus Staskawiczbacteria bacterium RIFOXYD1_FULL_32_13 TaxID=1802234 RepID=A0A1G2JQM9_9BACT|nr:MAG: hypothetical protein UR22_C0002G0027 [Parcubacteria group bacterium GW2011_GWC2_32_10]OGZ80199.1 MAG: hypothetical protein A2256_00170 [Candidatus Staskawiczbacteria bacterium RIFOXYA2_FULL_32_7]OGZ80751.1 MAG: hypothetical protein A2360_02500 [Candidatus Staskawiczbacteria bacterium RIFOXYB1_FULL_32_11]OGZ82287.1 MAG: hypothetical protein A2312_03695 [Candidatus Staskawiczbacteria bacterium RIFOXYB2_FULL_32_9]OGZ86870.1 MAG: hypothetical protein A2463_01830 [Candidatus Staskawiczbacter